MKRISTLSILLLVRLDLESTNLVSYSEHELIAAGLFNDVDSVLDLTTKLEHWNPYSVLLIDDDDDIGIS